MHIEHLSHWVAILTVKCTFNRYGHAGIPVVGFTSSGGSPAMNTMILA